MDRVAGGGLISPETRNNPQRRHGLTAARKRDKVAYTHEWPLIKGPNDLKNDWTEVHTGGDWRKTAEGRRPSLFCGGRGSPRSSLDSNRRWRAAVLSHQQEGRRTMVAGGRTEDGRDGWKQDVRERGRHCMSRLGFCHQIIPTHELAKLLLYHIIN